MFWRLYCDFLWLYNSCDYRFKVIFFYLLGWLIFFGNISDSLFLKQVNSGFRIAILDLIQIIGEIDWRDS